MKELIPMIIYGGLFLVVVGYVCFYLVLKERKRPKLAKSTKKPKKQEKQAKKKEKKEETKETVVVQQNERKKREMFDVIDVDRLAEQSPFKEEEEITEEQKQNEVIIIQNFEPLKYESEKEKQASQEKEEEGDIEEEIKRRLKYHAKKIDRTSPIQVEDENKNELN